MMQQINQELSCKDMVFSKKCIQLSKVVGQGRCLYLTYIHISILLVLLCRRVRIGVLWLP